MVLSSPIKKLEQKLGLPALAEVTSVLNDNNIKRIDSILTRLERLGQNKNSLTEAIQLLQLVLALGKTGDLERLESILKRIPKGKTGHNLIAEVRGLITDLDAKLDKVSSLAENILKSE